jgi:hypothetical protein
MMIGASGRLALILATGLFVGFAGQSQAIAAGADTTSTSENATSANTVKQGSRHVKRSAQRKPENVASKSSDGKKTADVADAAGNAPSALPAAVANAKAQLTGAAPSPNNANAMSAKANMMLTAGTDTSAEAQPAADPDVVASDQLNEVDRALQQSQSETAPPPQQQTVAIAPVKAAPVLAGGESKTWDQTSLIGKIFIGFGALLTMASAARMFMA